MKLMASSKSRSPHLLQLHSLPDLVIDKILQCLPTKAAFQASFPSRGGGGGQWKDVASCLRSLNFNEDDDLNRHNLPSYYRCYEHQHKKFIKFLEGYLHYHKRYNQNELLCKLSLDLRMYTLEDSCIITKWLEYACDLGLEELEISPKMSVCRSQYTPGYRVVRATELYGLPWPAIASATCLTNLKLEFVGVPFITVHSNQIPSRVFPCLKTLSFKTAHFINDQVLHSVLYECPSLESLSLIDCCIENSACYIACSSLKSLEVSHCCFDVIQVDEASNLESFTFFSLPLSFSRYSSCRIMVLNNAFNLKHINIRVDGDIHGFSLLGCHPTLQATIQTQRIHQFVFSNGCLDASVSVIAYDFFEATISVREFFSQAQLLPYPTLLRRLMNFLTRFQKCRKVVLYGQDVPALIVPKCHRMWNLTPLPNTVLLEVRMTKPPLMGSVYSSELFNSLRWMAPNAYIRIAPWDVEEDRRIVEQQPSLQVLLCGCPICHIATY